ncbi:hypothetical protein RB25_02940 [Herbaspirillum rubrisubalbicans]|uniref:Uncharacterized protein n=1 Tax=Herbaspirillum rubrisubalbicans TaxID=80842 RepID=A0ABX9BUL5_9BURK|nr:hypothetical protein [Herbaspirillum rubrisubalbicans]RAM61265.1 hypothetical protein RB24_26035 [Herbaspirillum rubrisubalbicans]RAN50104.1 hypothetical protein RB25_02940 [Herbaspirillum rubrisubalbicans]
MTTANLNAKDATRQHLKDDLAAYLCAQKMLYRRSITGQQWDVIWEGRNAIGKRLAWRLDLLGGLLGEW